MITNDLTDDDRDTIEMAHRHHTLLIDDAHDKD
jgi:hypothetical protein